SEMTEWKDESPHVLPRWMQQKRPRHLAPSALISQKILVAACLSDRVCLITLHASDPETNGVCVAGKDVVRIPALDLDDDDPQVRSDDHEIGIAITDHGFVVDDPI